MNSEGLYRSFEEQIERPPVIDGVEDPRIRSFLKAFKNGGYIDSMLVPALQARDRYRKAQLIGNIVSGSYAVNIATRATNYLLFDTPGYPENYTTEELYAERLHEIKTDPDRRQLFIDIIKTKDVRSNIPERSKTLLLFMELLKNRLPQHVIVADVGSSQGTGDKKILLKHPFDPVKVIADAGQHTMPHTDYDALAEAFTDIVSFKSPSDNYDTQIVQANHGMPSPHIRNIVAVDVIDPADEFERLWAKVCSFYTSEFINKQKLKMYEWLESQTKVKGLGFINENFIKQAFRAIALERTEFGAFETDDDHEERMDFMEGRKVFDIAFLSTVLYQLTEDDRRNMLKVLPLYVKPGGFIIIQDHAYVADDHKRLEIFEDWHAERFRYRTLVVDTAHPELGFQELFKWSNGRCKELMLGNGVFVPSQDADKPVTVSELAARLLQDVARN